METEASHLALAKSIYYVCLYVYVCICREKETVSFLSFFFLIFAKIYFFFSHKM